ncbi:MAG: thiopeptide-type bacteriocin biosynthesis protein [Acidobacteriota bacterium]
MTWASYHLHLPADGDAAADRLLAGEILSAVHQEEEAGRLRRFFFLRYGEGGPHLRLRFLPRSGAAGLSAASSRYLQAEVEGWARDLGGHFEAQPYDRGGQYFGQRVESVYAELLNLETTRLALALLERFPPDQRVLRWIATTCAMAELLRASTGGAIDREVEEGRDFARRVARDLGFDTRKAEQTSGRAAARAVAQAMPQIAGGLPEPLMKPIADLLRRCRRRRGPLGRQVAVHGLHLLCNKTGFTLTEEQESYATLAFLASNPKGIPS